MSKGSINFSNNNEYYTPKILIDYFGKFDYDPSTTKEQAEYLNIKNYDTIETNGLLSDWSIYYNIWINPPFTIKHKFLEKAYETYKKTKNNIYILLPIEFITTKRFYNIVNKIGGKLYIPKGRIKFISGKGKQNKSPAFGTIILKVQDKWEIEFIDFEEVKSNAI